MTGGRLFPLSSTLLSDYVKAAAAGLRLPVFHPGLVFVNNRGKDAGRRGNIHPSSVATERRSGGSALIFKMKRIKGFRLHSGKCRAYLWQRGVELENLPFPLHLAHAYLTGQVHSAGREALQSEATVEVPLWTAPHLLKGQLLQRDDEKIYSSVAWKTFLIVFLFCFFYSERGVRAVYLVLG